MSEFIKCDHCGSGLVVPEIRNLQAKLEDVGSERNAYADALHAQDKEVATLKARVAELAGALRETLDCLEQNAEDPDEVAVGIIRAALSEGAERKEEGT